MEGSVSEESNEATLGSGVCPFCGAGGAHPFDWDSWRCGTCNREYPTSASKCRSTGCWEFASHENYCTRHLPRGLHLLDQESYSVLVTDLFHFMDQEGQKLETGFPTWEAARNYARAKTWSSVQGHKKAGLSADEVKRLWMAFGESAIVIGGPSYSAKDEIDYFLHHDPRPEDSDDSRIVRATEPQQQNPQKIQITASLRPAPESLLSTSQARFYFPSIRIEPVGAWALTGLLLGIAIGLVRINVHLPHSTYQSLYLLEQLIWFVDGGFLLPIWGSTAGRKMERNLAWLLFFALWGIATCAFIALVFHWI
ncbi:MAG: hypothetical protein K2Y51_03565 [Gammaproteobacteria bacterium]|jgi:hypothetical protein|nr:hypothetical protein [Gammaproteobacteria bacterium]